MTGTEKQIKWAEDIKETIRQTMEIMIADNKAQGRDTSKAESLTAKMMANMDAEYAGHIINDFKDCRFEKFVDPEAKVATYGWASEEIKAESWDYEIARYERENLKTASRNYKKLNEALYYAQKDDGRNYVK